MNDLSALPTDLQAALKAEMTRGERLLYAGRPGIHIGPGEIVVSIFYAAFATFWCSISFTFGFIAWAGVTGFAPDSLRASVPGGTWGALGLAVFSLPFVLIGLGLVTAPIYGLLRARRSVHAITSDRIITVHAKPFGSVQSYPITTVTFVHRKDHRNGRGSLRIGHGTERDSDGDIRALEMQWISVPDAKRAESALLDLMRREKRRVS